MAGEIGQDGSDKSIGAVTIVADDSISPIGHPKL